MIREYKDTDIDEIIEGAKEFEAESNVFVRTGGINSKCLKTLLTNFFCKYRCI